MVSDAAKKVLAKRGYDQTMGARPLRRTIQREIEDQLSEKILFGELSKGDLVLVDADGEGKDAKFTFSGTPKALSEHTRASDQVDTDMKGAVPSSDDLSGPMDFGGPVGGNTGGGEGTASLTLRADGVRPEHREALEADLRAAAARHARVQAGSASRRVLGRPGRRSTTAAGSGGGGTGSRTSGRSARRLCRCSLR